MRMIEKLLGRIFLCALATFLFISTIENARAQDIEIAGSEPMLPIVQELAKEFMLLNPNAKIEVKGGTTGVGFAELVKGTINIANAANRINPETILALRESNRPHLEFVLALDNLCLVVNAANPLKKLTLEQIKKIYTGEILNWSEIGGENRVITLYGRELTSAQAQFLKDKADISQYHPSMRQMTDADEVAALKDDPSGIAFVGMAYAIDSSITAVSLAKKEGFEYLDPFNEALTKNGYYPLTRKLYQYTTADKFTPIVKQFIKFEFTKTGLNIITKSGVYSISDEDLEENQKKFQ